METLFFIALAIGLVVAGSAATFAITVLLPRSVQECAERNGRFVGLDACVGDSGNGSGKRVGKSEIAVGYGKLQLH